MVADPMGKSRAIPTIKREGTEPRSRLYTLPAAPMINLCNAHGYAMGRACALVPRYAMGDRWPAQGPPMGGHGAGHIN